MIFGQLVSVARLFAQFHAGTKYFLGTFGRLCLNSQYLHVFVTFSKFIKVVRN